MKYISKIILILLMLVPFACDNTEFDLLDNPNAVTADKADADLFFNRIQLDFRSFYARANIVSHTAIRHRAMTGGNTYTNAWEPQTFDGLWNNAYSNMFPDMAELLTSAEEKELFVHLGATKIMKAYVLMTLVDLFGDVPYSEAGLGLENPAPTADDDAVVYAEALSLLTEAITDLGKAPKALPLFDPYYDGDASAWIKAANSMLLKYWITVRLSDSGAGAAISSLVSAGNLISSDGDDFIFQYGDNRTNPNTRHPWYNGFYEAGGPYMSNYYMWSMRGGETGSDKTVADPRIRYYFYRQDLDISDENQFTIACPLIDKPLHYGLGDPWCVATSENTLGATLALAADGYWGRDHGNNDGIPPDGDKRTAYGIYPAGGKFDAGGGGFLQTSGNQGALGEGMEPMMLTSFVEFMRAEAAEVGLTPENARTLLEQAVRTSINRVMTYSDDIGDVDAAFVPSSTDIDNYVSEVLANYDSPAANGFTSGLDVIMREYWLASWGNGLEAFNGYRRTGFPSGMQLTRDPDSGEFPRLMLYPSDYVNLNANASQRVITDQVFWDTNPAGFIN